jgi:hypothetical protein
MVVMLFNGRRCRRDSGGVAGVDQKQHSPIMEAPRGLGLSPGKCDSAGGGQ